MGDLRKLLALYADVHDCPVCFASPRLVGSTVKTWPSGRGQTMSGGRWHVEHGLSCDVRRALEEGGTSDG